MRRLDVAGIVAIVIAATMGGAVVLALAGVVFTGKSLSEQGAHALSTICGALISVLSTIVGGMVKGAIEGRSEDG
jgi:hypothetical protein